MPQGEQEFERTYKDGTNYICTDPDSWATLQEWIVRTCRE